MARTCTGSTTTFLVALLMPLPVVASPIDDSLGEAGNWSIVAVTASAGPKPALLMATPQGIDCLTSTIYYEAAREPRSGQEAVAQVVLNRLARPTFPKTVCGVVYQGSTRATGCQFTFACDGSLSRRPVPALWARARAVAAAALDGHVDAEIGASTHYHAVWMKPYWAASLVATRRIGGHQFYRQARDLVAADVSKRAPTPARHALDAVEPSQLPLTASRKSQNLAWGLPVATASFQHGAIVIRGGA